MVVSFLELMLPPTSVFFVLALSDRGFLRSRAAAAWNHPPLQWEWQTVFVLNRIPDGLCAKRREPGACICIFFITSDGARRASCDAVCGQRVAAFGIRPEQCAGMRSGYQRPWASQVNRSSWPCIRIRCPRDLGARASTISLGQQPEATSLSVFVGKALLPLLVPGRPRCDFLGRTSTISQSVGDCGHWDKTRKPFPGTAAPHVRADTRTLCSSRMAAKPLVSLFSVSPYAYAPLSPPTAAG